ncbi:MAG: hypothetical protein SPH33_07700 [Atopobiaceae bacterium]|nr:hypothetical protein [Atopobiaceae bacterium]
MCRERREGWRNKRELEEDNAQKVAEEGRYGDAACWVELAAAWFALDGSPEAYEI